MQLFLEVVQCAFGFTVAVQAISSAYVVELSMFLKH